MGHKTISMTCRYAHLAPSHNLAAVERLTESAGVQKTLPDPKTDISIFAAADDVSSSMVQVIQH